MKSLTKIFYYILHLSIIFAATSCKWTKEKTIETVHKAGEIVGKTSSEFGDGIYKGIKKTFENEITLSKELKQKGIEIGELNIYSDSLGNDNIASVYIIFNESFDDDIQVKLINESGKEYGRSTQKVQATKGEAHFVDFLFEKRVSIGMKGKIMLE